MTHRLLLRYANGYRLLISAALLAAAVMSLGEGARAVSTLTFQAVTLRGDTAAPQGRVYAGSQSVMTLAGHGAQSPAAAQEVARRLNDLAEAGLKASEISLWTERRTRAIVARGERILVVDKEIAAAHHSDLDQLARAWAENLRTVFSQPYLSMKRCVVPVGESRAAPLLGNISGRVQVRVEAPVANAVWDDASKSVRVSGLQEGETQLVVFDDTTVLIVPLAVMKYAASWTQMLPARVTGNPAPAEVVARAVKAAAAASMVLEPGAWGRVTPLAEGLRPLPQGKSAEAPVSLAATGDHYLTCRQEQQVLVRNDRLRLQSPSLLMVSNSPEKLASYGLWFEGKLQGDQAVRLLYHHVNATAGKADLVVEIWNLGDQTAHVHIVEGTGGPSYDEAWAGHRAASQFLANQAAGVGWVAPLPAGMVTPIVAQSAGKGATVSGVLELRGMSSETVSVRIYLVQHSPERLPRPIGTYRESPLLGQWHYSEPRKELKAQYTVGRQWAFVTIGRTPTPGMVAGDELRGGYGVIYDIDLELVNPTAQEARIALVMEPAGGPARGTVLIDGRLVEAAMLRQDVEAPLSRYALAPGEVRRVRLQTMPQAGSNYPVRLVARPV